jgi:hypothetical protein
MKPLIIKLLLILLLSPLILQGNNPGKDFLITLDGAKLTGNIKHVSLTKGGSYIHFENDFGDTYNVYAATIYGFAFREAGEISLYESKCLYGEWRFLKVEKRGDVLSLYKSSERQLQFTNAGASPIVVEEKNPQIWLQFKGEQPFKIYRISYRRILRNKMKSFPDLAQSIGKRGFRYHNLSMIVDLYNKFHSQK